MTGAHAVTGHPLDPLDADELARAVALVRARDGVRLSAVVSVSLDEPAQRDDGTPRGALVVWIDRVAGATHEALVDLERDAVVSSERVRDGHAAFVPEEVALVEELVKSHPDFVRALDRRDLSADDVEVGLFPAGNREAVAGAEGHRVFRTSTWLRRDRRPYTTPVEGIVAMVDVDARRVLDVSDHGVVPLPPPAADYRADSVAPRAGLKPLTIEQSEGPSFTLDGHELSWQGWRMRLGFTPREGLVLHDVGHEDGDRGVLRRASLSEMVVPYAHSGPGHYDRAVFDVGEGLLGLCANSLALGCDCLGEIRYVDAVVNDHAGGARTIVNAICIHEEDDGILWKHTDADGNREVRRSRKLVVSWFATLDNYDYGFYWSFRQDGSVEMEVKLTGIVLVEAVAPGATPIHGELVAPQLSGILHQHFFCFRLHADVDSGPANVIEREAAAVPAGAGNPYLNAFDTAARELTSESEARRDASPATARTWQIASRTRRNALGGATAYELMPGPRPAPLAHADSSFLRRAGFVRHSLWVTPYEPGELFAAGDYPNLHRGGAGLPAWTAGDRPLDGDVVLWHTVGLHHVPRPEDWPVMPVARVGFMLRPTGFFDLNPGNDVPAPEPAHGSACGHC